MRRHRVWNRTLTLTPRPTSTVPFEMDRLCNGDGSAAPGNPHKSSTRTPDPLANPYHPYEETDRFRAFRDGWEAHQRWVPRTDNPYAFAQVGRALAWLDGWTAAAREEGGAIDEWRRPPAFQVRREYPPQDRRREEQ